MVRNNLPSEDEYTLVGCPDCEALQVVKGRPETTKCDRCRKSLSFRDLNFIYQSDEAEAVRRARALKLAERNDDRDAYVELLESGVLDGEIARSISDEDFLERMGVDVDEVEEYQASGGDDVSVPEALRLVVESGELTSEGAVSEVVEEYGFDESRVRDRLERLRDRGEVIRKGDGTLKVV